MFETIRNKISNDVVFYFLKNYNSSFYKIKSKEDNRVMKNKVIGSKMNYNDFEYAVNVIVNNINDNLLNNNDNIVNNIINNIINFNNSYQNYESMYLYLKLKNNVVPGTVFNYKSFTNKYEKIKQNNSPFYLMLCPNYEWCNLIIGFNQI
jgi:hypothetical protein